MKKLASLHPLALSVVIFLAMTFAAPSATITVATNMNWSSLTGGSQSGGQPNSADTVIVNNNATLTIDATNDLCGFLQLGDSTNASAGGSIVFNPGSSLLVDNGVFPPSGILTIGVSGGGPGSINLSAGGRLGADTITVGNPGTWTPAPTPTGATVALGAGTFNSATLGFFRFFNNLTIAGGDTSSPAYGTVLGGPVVVTGNLEVLGYCQLDDSGNYPIFVAGNLTFDGQDGGGKPNFNPGNGAIILNGGAPQTVNNSDPASSFANLTISNSAGVTLGANITVTGILTLTNGILTTGGAPLVLTSGASVSGGSASSYVNGAVQAAFAVKNNQSFTFPIGNAGEYAPLSLTSLNVTAPGSLTALTVAGEHPQIATSGINTNADVDRYWTLTNSPGGIAVASYSATFNYPASDLDAGAVPSSFVVRQWAGSTPWTNISLSQAPTTNATSASLSGAAFGDFSIGDSFISVASSQNPSPLGGAVTFTATVTSMSGTPTGIVTFMDGTNTLGVGTVNASGVANFSTAGLSANSPHSITAAYGGDSNNVSDVSDPLLQTVFGPVNISIVNGDFEADFLADGASTTNVTAWSGISPPGTDYGTFNPTDSTYTNTSVNSPGNSAGDLPPPAAGVNLAYLDGATIYQTLSNVLTSNTTYTLTGALGQRFNGTGGTGGGAPCSAALLATATNGDVLVGGTNTFVIPEPTPGTFDGWSLTYVAPASGPDIGQAIVIELISSGSGFSSGGQAGFSNIKLVSSGLATTTALASSQNPSSNNTSVTFTATVNSAAGTTMPSNGTVTFMEGTITLGSATLSSSGQASFSTSALPDGTNMVMAIYGGSGIYAGSFSSNLSQLVTSSGFTTTTVSSSTGGISTYGQPVAFSATVTGSDGGGTVAFYADASPTPLPGCAAIPLTGGVATTPGISTLAVGVHSISAVYSGDSNATSSTGNLAGGQTVNALNQTITFGSLTNQTYGVAPYSISATASSGLPVSFAVVSGPATIAVSNVTITGAGTVYIRASQGGNSNYNAATPVTNSFIVSPRAVVLTGARAYDGTNDAAFVILSVANVLGSDNVNLASGSATLAGPGVGLQTIISVGTLALGGTNAASYTLAGATGSVTITNSFNPFSITSSSLDVTGTNVVVCWQSVPGVVYNVMTNTGLDAPESWAAAGAPITATNTTTCFKLPGGIVGHTNTFVVIKQ